VGVTAVNSPVAAATVSSAAETVSCLAAAAAAAAAAVADTVQQQGFAVCSLPKGCVAAFAQAWALCDALAAARGEYDAAHFTSVSQAWSQVRKSGKQTVLAHH
jgi:hypothetical protein